MEAAKRKLGINVLGGQGGLSVPEHIALIGSVGWDGFFTGWDPNRTEAWANAGAQSGLVYTSIHAPFSNEQHIWNHGEMGDVVTANLIACAEDCARFGIPVMVLHTMNGFSKETPAAPTQIGLDRYARIVEAGDRLGIRLAFENTEREEFLEAVMTAFWDAPSLGFCFDSGHEHCYRNSDLLTRYGEKLCHTHLDDNFGVTGDVITWYDDSHLPMGDATVDFGRVMDRIDAVGYEGILTCELTMKDKPHRHTHGAYAEMPVEDFYALALDRAQRVRDRRL